MAYKNDSPPYTASQYVSLNDTEEVSVVMHQLLILLYLISGNNQAILYKIYYMSRPTRGQNKQCRPTGLVQCKIAVLWTRYVKERNGVVSKQS